MKGVDLTQFVLGFAIGAGVFWQVSKAVERYRRARRDWAAAKAGIRTLLEMTFRRGWQAIQGVMLGAVVVAVMVFVWAKTR